MVNRCPRCGCGSILKNLFHRLEECSECKLEYSREDGFFIGGIPISYGLICGFWIVPLLVVWTLEWLPGDWSVWLGLGGAFAWPIISYRYCQCLWLGLYFVFAENEMPDQLEQKCYETHE